MNKKNTIILSIISIATLLITIFGATYSYLNSDFVTSNSSHVESQTDSIPSYFTSFSSGSLFMYVDSIDMLQSNSSDTEAPAELTKSANINANLLAPSENVIGKCSFDIIMVWDKNSDTYIKSENVDKELTIMTETTMSGLQTLTSDEDPNGDYVNSSTDLEETNLDDLNWIDDGEKLYAVLVDDAIISNYSKTNFTIFNYKVTLKFYNSTYSQDTQKSKNYNSSIEISDLQCN